MARKSISKKVRFEVFKRDSFTCQYCGKSAPDVILHIDHIDPVSKGGDNEIINLITACLDCNSGKSNVPLGDQSMLAKQREQLAELNERREQLEMMLAWREGLKDLKESEVDAIAEHWTNALGKHWGLNENGRREAQKLLRRFPLSKLLEAIDTSVDRYVEWKDQRPTKESISTAWWKVGGICAVQAMPQDERDLRYVRGIVRNRMYCNEREAAELLREALGLGMPIDEMKDLAKTARNWTDWRECMTRRITELLG